METVKNFDEIAEYFYLLGAADGILKSISRDGGKPNFKKRLDEFKLNNPKLFNKPKIVIGLFSLDLHYRIKYALRDYGFTNESSIADLINIDKKRFLKIEGVNYESYNKLKAEASKHGITIK
jgi:hypothetical protein